MKNILFICCFFWCIVAGLDLRAQAPYDDAETAKLHKFLRQESAEPGMKNYEQLGIEDIENIDWGKVDGLSWNSLTFLLERVYWPNKKLAGDLDFSDFRALRYLYLSFNEINSVDVTNAVSLLRFDLYENNLSYLDVMTNINVEYIRVGYNNIKKVDLSNNHALDFFCCTDNMLDSLDLSGKEKLRTVYCVQNNITYVNVDNCLSLSSFLCGYNKLTKLELYNLPSLESVSCIFNNLTELSFYNCGSLKEVFCEYNLLESLDLSPCESLSLLSCSNNNLTELNVKEGNSLKTLDCDNNFLDSLEIPNSLSSLSCKNNNLDFLSLPPVTESLKSYSYTPQNAVALECRSDSIDFSRFYSINDSLSNYIWYYKNTTIAPLQNKVGIFTFDESYVGAVLICLIQNKMHPKLVMHYDVTLKSADDVGNKNPEISSGSVVYADKGVVHVMTKFAMDVRIFSLNGTNVFNKNIGEGHTTIPLERGIYVVLLNNNDSYKVSVR